MTEVRNEEMKVPAKDKVLTCTANKVQLIDIICDFIVQKVSSWSYHVQMMYQFKYLEVKKHLNMSTKRLTQKLILVH